MQQVVSEVETHKFVNNIIGCILLPPLDLYWVFQ